VIWRADERRSASVSDQQLHQIAVGRENSLMENEHIIAAHILMDFNVDFLVGEALAVQSVRGSSRWLAMAWARARWSYRSLQLH